MGDHPVTALVAAATSALQCFRKCYWPSLNLSSQCNMWEYNVANGACHLYSMSAMRCSLLAPLYAYDNRYIAGSYIPRQYS